MGVLASMMGTERWNTPRNSSVFDVGGAVATHTTAGEVVTPDGAMQLSAYFACIRNIAEDIGKLPLILYERLQPRGKRRATDSKAYGLVHRKPNENQTAIQFREQLTGWAAGWGYGYAEIERNATGDPTNLWPVHPSRAVKIRNEGRYFFKVINDDRTFKMVADSDMLEIPGTSVFGDGKSALRARAESIGVGLAAQTFAAAYYGNGMGISMAIIHPGKLSPEAHARMRESWASMHQGAGRAHRPFIGEEGLKVEKISIPANEAQFLETRMFQLEEICRWFRMPPHKIQHLQRAAGWSTLEASNTDYIVDTLMPWLVRWEQELSRKLLFESEQDSMFFEFLVNGLLRGDMAARAAFYKSMFEMGALSSNDILELENMNPREGGDTYFTTANVQSDEQRAANPEPLTPAAPAPAPSEDDDDDEASDQASRAMMPVMADSLRRVIGKEVKLLKPAATRHKSDPGAFNKWADEFYANHKPYMVGVLTPCIEAAIAIHGKQVDITAFVTQHIEDSRNAIEDAYAFDRIGEMCEHWQTIRFGASVQALSDTLFPKDSQ